MFAIQRVTVPSEIAPFHGESVIHPKADAEELHGHDGAHIDD